ncbi:MAG: PKD domain-containing protein [Bacteroidia bacterium]
MNLSLFLKPLTYYLFAVSYVVLSLEPLQAQRNTTPSHVGAVITSPSPSANFGVSRSCMANPNQAVKVVNFSKNAAYFVWHFEGGEPAYFEGKQPPEIRYPEAGTYDITLLAQDEFGRTDTLKAENFIRVGHSIDFSANVRTTSCAPLMTTFKAQLTGCVRRYKWDFGDGSVSSSQASPMHVYNQNGNYDVKLVITYEDGTKDSLVKKAYMQISSLAGTYQVDKNQIATNGKVMFNIYTNAHVMLEPRPGEVQFAMKSNPANVWDSVKMSYTYTEVGFYEPVVRLMSDDGCMTTLASKGGIWVADTPKNEAEVVTNQVAKKPKAKPSHLDMKNLYSRR